MHTDNWEDTIKQNYETSKDYVDTQWDSCMTEWKVGSYFNAGMFYERVWLKLTGLGYIM